MNMYIHLKMHIIAHMHAFIHTCAVDHHICHIISSCHTVIISCVPYPFSAQDDARHARELTKLRDSTRIVYQQSVVTSIVLVLSSIAIGAFVTRAYVVWGLDSQMAATSQLLYVLFATNWWSNYIPPCMHKYAKYRICIQNHLSCWLYVCLSLRFIFNSCWVCL